MVPALAEKLFNKNLIYRVPSQGIVREVVNTNNNVGHKTRKGIYKCDFFLTNRTQTTT